MTQSFQTSIDVTSRASVHDIGVVSDTGYNAQIVSTRRAQSGQHINLVRSGNAVWSIGYIYNTNNFGIGIGQSDDSAFVNPSIFIDASTGFIGLTASNPTARVSIAAISNAGVATRMFETKFNADWGLRLYQNYVGAGNIMYELRTQFAAVEYALMTFKQNRVGVKTTDPQASVNVGGGILVGAAESVVTQGGWLMWNRSDPTGNGRTYLINQRGLGTGGVSIGEAETNDAYTENLLIDGSGIKVLGGAYLGKTLMGAVDIGTAVSIGAGQYFQFGCTVTGATLSHFALATSNASLPGGFLVTARVTGANNVVVVIYNASTIAQNLPVSRFTVACLSLS